MPKLYSSAQIVSVLGAHGFVFVSQKGSHAKYRKIKNGATLTVIVPANRKQIPQGTFRSIARQAQLSATDFE